MSADPRHFLYRGLDPDGAKRLAAEHLSACDDGELFLQYNASESFGFDDGRLKTADYHTSSGFGLRGVTGETTVSSKGKVMSPPPPPTALSAPAPTVAMNSNAYVSTFNPD